MKWPWGNKQPEQTVDVEAIANQVAKQMGLNANSAETLRSVMARAASGTYDGADTLHNVYLDYGYPEQLTFVNFWNMYRRFGIAANVIELPVDTGWSSTPEIGSNEAFKKEFEKLTDRLPLWARLKGVDKRQRVGRYAGLFMRVKDGKKPEEPIEGTLPGEAALFDITPLYESQLDVTETDSDPTSETFGRPVMYQYRGSVEGDRNDNNLDTVDIHASRVIPIAEGADDGSIYGIPALENIYNSLLDLRKVIGGAGEGFYKNAAQTVAFELQDTASASSLASKLAKFNEEWDAFARNRFRRAMWTPGLKPHVLTSAMADPESPFNVALNDVAAGSKIPATILTGQQTGRLASDEDSANYLAQVQSRRENFMTDMISDAIDWMIKWGILPSADYEIVWDDLLARSDEDKLTNAGKMAEINKNQFTSGGDIPFSGEEIREAAGFDPEEEIEPGDEGEEEEIE